MMKIAIVGSPHSGKTTLAHKLAEHLIDHPVVSADQFMDRGWGEQPHLLVAKCAEYPKYIAEGVTVARALRYGLQPDVVVWVAGGSNDRKFASINKIIADRVGSYEGKVVAYSRDIVKTEADFEKFIGLLGARN